MDKKAEILSEKIIEKKGSYRRVRRWLRGKYPELGNVIRGLTGYETVQEVDVAEPEILGEEIIQENKSFRRVRRWLRGMYPELGVLVKGLTGWETLQEIDVIKATTIVDLSNYLRRAA